MKDDLIYPKARREGVTRIPVIKPLEPQEEGSDGKKYYFFRDLDHNANLSDGRSYHAFGIVDKVFNDSETYSGKDLSVRYFNPFDQIVGGGWRTYSEVELFEAGEWEWKALAATLDMLDTYLESDEFLNEKYK